MELVMDWSFRFSDNYWSALIVCLFINLRVVFVKLRKLGKREPFIYTQS